MGLIGKLKTYGAKVVLKIIFKRIFFTEILKLHYLKVKLDNEVLKEQANNLDLNVKELSYNDFLLGFSLEFNLKKLEIIKNRFKDNSYKAYGIVLENKLIYSAWISLKKIGLPIKSNIFLEESEGYLEDDFCHPDFRGKGIHTKMNIFRKLKLSELGKKECVVIIMDGNIPAIKAQLNAGAVNLGFFYAGTILGIPFVRFNKKKYDSK